MKHFTLSALVLIPALSGCLAGGYAPTGSFSPNEPFPAMGPDATVAPATAYGIPSSQAAQPPLVQPQPGMQPYGRQPQPLQTTARQQPVVAHVQGANASSQGPARPVVGWGGDLVQAPVGGTISAVNPTRGLGPSETGRMQILELYQGVVDERDALSDEVFALRSELSHRDQMLKRSDQGSNDLLSQIASLKSDKQKLTLEVEELLARLTTAQIRRLEAEKLVLESKISEFSSKPEDSDNPYAEDL